MEIIYLLAVNSISWQMVILRVAVFAIMVLSFLILFKLRINTHYEKEISTLESRLRKIEKEKKKLEEKIEEMKDKIRKKNAEISRINEKMKKSQDTIKDLKSKFEDYKKVKEYAKKLKEENEALKRELEEKEIELEEKEMKIEEMKEYIPGVDQEHFGDLDYWTGKRLYELRKKFPRMGYRKMEEMTGVTKSTIERRIKKYAGHLTDK